MSHSFRTEINCLQQSAIGHHHKIMTIGSCFADQFGEWLKVNKFKVCVSPFGTTYNPVSIHQLLLQAVDNTVDDSLFTERDGFWYHYNYHSKWAAATQKQLKQEIQHQQQIVRSFLNNMDLLILTYGTAWSYRLKRTDQVVANCQKTPASFFTKRLLTESEIRQSFDELHKKVKALNPSLQIIVTVSPVRHIKDTLELNSVSKGLLRLASHQIATNYPEVDYFPAFEIMMDDLRDYRFYERDMIHPSAEARDYINQKFSDRYFTPETMHLIATLTDIRKALAHRPFQHTAPAHQKFLKDTLQKLESVKQIVSVEEEIQLIQSNIIHD